MIGLATLGYIQETSDTAPATPDGVDVEVDVVPPTPKDPSAEEV